MNTIDALVAEMTTAMADPSVTWGVGSLALNEHAHDPRIVAVEVDGVFNSDIRPGRYDYATTSTRELYVRVATVQWYCWGSDGAVAEALMNNLLVLMRRSDMMASVQPVSYTRLQHGEDASWLTRGDCYVLACEHDIGVPDAVVPLRSSPTAGVHTGTMQQLAGGPAEVGCT